MHVQNQCCSHLRDDGCGVAEARDQIKIVSSSPVDQPETGLSSGQQQRLCIARAIAVEPDVKLMDKPCSAHDPIPTARVEELIDSAQTFTTPRDERTES